MAKRITIEDLANMMSKGFNKVDKDIEDLAIMVAKGFEKLEKRVTNLEDGQEAVLLRLDNLAPNFEIKELKRRMNRVETRLKIN